MRNRVSWRQCEQLMASPSAAAVVVVVVGDMQPGQILYVHNSNPLFVPMISLPSSTNSNSKNQSLTLTKPDGSECPVRLKLCPGRDNEPDSTFSPVGLKKGRGCLL